MLSQIEIEDIFDRIGPSEDNIIVIDDFLDKEILSILNDFIKNKTNGIQDDYTFISKKMFKDENVQVFNILVNLEKEIPHSINAYLKRFSAQVGQKPLFNMTLASRIPNTEMEEHFDYNPEEIGNGNIFANITSLIYLNDDYEGGEIVFPYQNTTYKPNSGSLLIFPSNYLHKVLECYGNSRYSILACYYFI